MKPARFRYFRPDNGAEVLAILGENGADARILAGGQSLVPLMNMRIMQPKVLIDIRRCAEFSYIRREGDVVAIGPLTRQGEAEFDPLVAEHLPLLAAALPHVGVRANRNFGTVCGSLAHADPLGELPSVAMALDARFVIASTRGRREASADEFFISALTNCLDPDEMLAEVRFPVTPKGAISVFDEVANRAHGFAVVGLAACFEVDGGGNCTRARFSAMGAGTTTVRLRDVEALVEGRRLDDAAIDAAGAAAARGVEPSDDIHASAAYRMQVIGSLVKKALRRARAAGPGGS